MIRRTSIALAASAAVIATPAVADETQLWSSVAVNGPAQSDGRLLLWFDGHLRTRNDVEDIGVTIIRPGIGWRATKNIDLWAGYARVVSRADITPDVKEDRIWQQATYKLGALGNVKFSGGTRLEQRFRGTGDDTGWRVRQTLGLEVPFENTPELSFILSNEIFIGLNDADWGQRSGYDQNRAFIGFGYKLAPKLKATAGYLNNNLDLAGGGSRTNHNISLGISLGL